MVIFCSSKKSNVLFHRDFNCANTSVRIFFFCFSKLLACPLFSDCSLNSFSSVWLFWTSYRPPPRHHRIPVILFTSPCSILSLWYCLKLFCLFVLFCIVSFTIPLTCHSFWNINSMRALTIGIFFFFLIFTDWSPVTNPLPDTQLASKSFLNECKCKHSQRST